jgi:excisionase family DNA binding protein
MAESTMIVSDLPNRTLITPKEAADFLRCTQKKVYYLVQFSDLDGVKIRGSLRIKRDSLIRMLGDAT